jgi:hypothetical protein
MGKHGLRLPVGTPGPSALVHEGMQRRFFFSWKCAMCDAVKFWGPDNERIEFIKGAGWIPTLDPAAGPRVFPCGELIGTEFLNRSNLDPEEVAEKLEKELESFRNVAHRNAK